MTDTQQRLVPAKEAAYITGITYNTLRQYRIRNHPFYTQKAIKIGRKIYYRHTDILTYINNL